jgi:cytochrome c oxidase subunit 2
LGPLRGQSTIPFGLVNTHTEYWHLFSIYVPAALVVIGLVVALFLFAALRYRGRPPERAARWHENHRLEGIYAVLLAATVAFLLYNTYSVENKIDRVANRERGGVTIDVVAARWEWTFYYPRYHITVRSGTTGVGTFVVPVNQPIHFYLSSVDVIHAFWIPGLDYKHDNFPGATMLSTLDFGKSGNYPGQCAEYCGLYHSEMVFNARAVSGAAFAAWAASGGRTPA